MKPKFLILPLLVGLSFGIVFMKTRSTSNETVAEIEKEQKTWESFTEYKRLEMILKGFAIESMIDIPCLSFDELKHNLGLKRYIGIAETRDQARALQAQYGSNLRTFLSFQVDVDTLPKSDLILCWDELCRYTTNRAKSALYQFKKSGAKFLLMRHFPEVKKNHKNKHGTFQPINWTLPPFNLPEPIIQIIEDGELGMESLALWNLEKI